MMFFLAISVSLLLGFLSCILIFKETKDISFRILMNLGFPMGMGLSCVIFISLNLLGLPTFLIFLIEIGVLLFLIFKIKKIPKPLYQFEWTNFNKLISTPVLLIATVIYCYSWVMDVGIYFFDSIKEPHGLWDAWMDWNLGAKFISRDPHNWTNSFHQITWGLHMDYPLLQKGFIARWWILAQTETVWVPIIFCFIITFCTIGLLASSVSYFTNKTNGLIAGLVLLATPFFMTMGDSQYADNTVGYFYLATIVLLTFARNGTTLKPHLLIGAGITAGLAAWSKNEGLLFIVCLFASQLILFLFKNYKELLQELKYMLIGLLPVLILVAYFKLVIAPPNDIMDAQGDSTFVKLIDYSRYEIIGRWYYDQFTRFGYWALNPWWLFLIGILITGINLKENRNNIIVNFTWLLLMLAGIFLIFVISHLDLVYYLSTSLHRLFFQLFPSFLFIYFLAIKTNKTLKLRD